uniref:Uncharacterized protein n=1 Tax=Lactuca sativa TaxID=4236 RepID=A0A9R1XW62_LACSA|nr:hypothetical protein LSAT_V11C100020960 [Lactuca sativa]
MHASEANSSSNANRYLDWNNRLVVSSEDTSEDSMCSLQDVGGHIMKIPIIAFQILLCLHMEGKHAATRSLYLPVIFSPLFLLQRLEVILSGSRLVEKIIILLCQGSGIGTYFTYSARARDCFGFLHLGSKLLDWWSIDEGSREEQSRLCHDGASGYNTFCGIHLK